MYNSMNTFVKKTTKYVFSTPYNRYELNDDR